MSQNKEDYDPRKDPSFMNQEVSPSTPYNPGPRPPRDTPLAYPQQRERLSRARLFFRKLFFGNTTPGTNAGNRTAFKRGLIIAMVIGLILSTPIAILGLAKGMTLLAVALPALMFTLACVFTAGIAMCIFNCCVRYCGRGRQYSRVEDSSLSSYTPNSIVEQDVQDFANGGHLLSGSDSSQVLSPVYYPPLGHTGPRFGQTVPGYSVNSPPQGYGSFEVASEVGDEDVVEDGYNPN